MVLFTLRFLRMCHEKEMRRQQYLLTKPQQINFHESILSTMQQKYREPWEKSQFINFARNEL